METTKQLWSLWAYCPTTSKKTLVARGPESEMRHIFDRLVRRDDRLQLVDAAGEKQSTTCGPLTDCAEPDDGSDPLGPNDRRLNAIEQTNTTIARRLNATERKQYEERKIREADQADQARREAYQADQARRLSGNIKRNLDEARSFAAEVGNEHRELKSCLADLRRDLETLAAQVDETTQALAKLATAQLVADRDQPTEPGDLVPQLRRDLATLEAEFGEALAEISRSLGR